MDESLQVAIDVWTGYIRLRRGKYDDDVDELLVRARNAAEMQVIAPALALAAEASADAGDVANATALLTEWEERTAGRSAMYRSNGAPSVVRSALAIGARELAETVVARSETVTMRDHVFIDTAAAVVRDARPRDVGPARGAVARLREPLRAGARRAGAGPADGRGGRRGPRYGDAARARGPDLGARGACDTSRPMDPEEEAELAAAAEPSGVFAGSEGKDFRVLAAGTAQNIVGLGVFVIGTFAANILIARSFGGGDTGATALAIVTLGTQFAFIAAAGTRMGMDMASVRYVSIEVGAGRPGAVRVVVARSVLIALVVSAVVGALTVALRRDRSGLDSRRTPRPFRRRSRRSGRRGSRSRSSASPTCGSAAAVG